LICLEHVCNVTMPQVVDDERLTKFVSSRSLLEPSQRASFLGQVRAAGLKAAGVRGVEDAIEVPGARGSVTVVLSVAPDQLGVVTTAIKGLQEQRVPHPRCIVIKQSAEKARDLKEAGCGPARVIAVVGAEGEEAGVAQVAGVPARVVAVVTARSRSSRGVRRVLAALEEDVTAKQRQGSKTDIRFSSELASCRGPWMSARVSWTCGVLDGDRLLEVLNGEARLAGVDVEFEHFEQAWEPFPCPFLKAAASAARAELPTVEYPSCEALDVVRVFASYPGIVVAVWNAEQASLLLANTLAEASSATQPKPGVSRCVAETQSVVPEQLLPPRAQTPFSWYQFRKDLFGHAIAELLGPLLGLPFLMLVYRLRGTMNRGFLPCGPMAALGLLEVICWSGRALVTLFFVFCRMEVPFPGVDLSVCADELSELEVVLLWLLGLNRMVVIAVKYGFFSPKRYAYRQSRQFTFSDVAAEVLAGVWSNPSPDQTRQLVRQALLEVDCEGVLTPAAARVQPMPDSVDAKAPQIFPTTVGLSAIAISMLSSAAPGGSSASPLNQGAAVDQPTKEPMHQGANRAVHSKAQGDTAGGRCGWAGSGHRLDAAPVGAAVSSGGSELSAGGDLDVASEGAVSRPRSREEVTRGAAVVHTPRSSKRPASCEDHRPGDDSTVDWTGCFLSPQRPEEHHTNVVVVDVKTSALATGVLAADGRVRGDVVTDTGKDPEVMQTESDPREECDLDEGDQSEGTDIMLVSGWPDLPPGTDLEEDAGTGPDPSEPSTPRLPPVRLRVAGHNSAARKSVYSATFRGAIPELVGRDIHFIGGRKKECIVAVLEQMLVNAVQAERPMRLALTLVGTVGALVISVAPLLARAVQGKPVAGTSPLATAAVVFCWFLSLKQLHSLVLFGTAHVLTMERRHALLEDLHALLIVRPPQPCLDFTKHETLCAWVFMRRAVFHVGHQFHARSQVVAADLLLITGVLVSLLLYYVFIHREAPLLVFTTAGLLVAISGCVTAGFVVVGIKVNDVQVQQANCWKSHSAGLFQSSAVCRAAGQLAEAAALENVAEQARLIGGFLTRYVERHPESIMGFPVNETFVTVLGTVAFSVVSATYDVILRNKGFS